MARRITAALLGLALLSAPGAAGQTRVAEGAHPAARDNAHVQLGASGPSCPMHGGGNAATSHDGAMHRHGEAEGALGIHPRNGGHSPTDLVEHAHTEAPMEGHQHTPGMIHPAGDSGDRAFHALQERGTMAMGVDQYSSTHLFDSLEDGGRIEFLMDFDDEEGIAGIRAHLVEIVQAFERGDFTIPAFIHAQEVPGTDVMRARRSSIRYEIRELPRGGEIRLTTRDPVVLKSIHDFMAFQREDHRAGGHPH